MDVFDRASIFATQRHSGQIRKMGATPYVLHPMEVASIIATITDDREVMAAGMLHDTVEDAGVQPEEIRALFGPRVAALVASETEDKLSSRPAAETWQERKEDTLMILQHTKDRDVKILWLGDKLSNMRSFRRNYDRLGDAMWMKFHQHDPEMHLWYYSLIASYLSELSDTDAYREYVACVEYVFSKALGREVKL